LLFHKEYQQLAAEEALSPASVREQERGCCSLLGLLQTEDPHLNQAVGKGTEFIMFLCVKIFPPNWRLKATPLFSS
jgi:hypothetical protein